MAKLKAKIENNKISFYRGELHICTAIIHEGQQTEFMFNGSIMADELLALRNAALMVDIYGFQTPNPLEFREVVEQYVDLI